MQKHFDQIHNIVKKNNKLINKKCNCYTLNEEKTIFKACRDSKCCSKSNIKNLVPAITGYLLLNDIDYKITSKNDIIFEKQ